MRWKVPIEGDTRIIKKFLIFPVCLCKEYRWLEKVKIKQEFVVNRKWGKSYWHSMYFIDDKIPKK